MAHGSGDCDWVIHQCHDLIVLRNDYAVGYQIDYLLTENNQIKQEEHFLVSMAAKAILREACFSPIMSESECEWVILTCLMDWREAYRRRGVPYNHPCLWAFQRAINHRFYISFPAWRARLIDIFLVAHSMPLIEDVKCEEDSDEACVICTDNYAIMTVGECGHTVMCRQCAMKIRNSTNVCPICRAHTSYLFVLATS